MNLLYCGDIHITKGICLSALSVCQNLPDQEPLHLYVLSLQIDSKEHPVCCVDQKLLKELEIRLQEVNPDSFVHVYEMSDKFKTCLPKANMDTRFTVCCMLRLYADLCEDIPDRILYLDADVLCASNPLEFYQSDLNGLEMAGVLDNYGKWWFHRNIFKQDYLNSGVLLLNMKEIKRSGLFSKSRQMCHDKKMFMPDQSSLNKVYEHVRIVERKYNEQKCLKEDTVFLHFTTQFKFFPWFHLQSIKPWQIDEVHSVLELHEFDDLYRKCAFLSLQKEQTGPNEKQNVLAI